MSFRIHSLQLLIILGISLLSCYANTGVQCNIGLKMYSVEAGKTICAPLTEYECIEACEWNTSCSQTTHFKAYKGRRTYVSGLILSEKQYLVQCCASMATIVQSNKRHQPMCVWTSWVNSVQEFGSIRLDPPLNKNEYIRDIRMERIENTGRVQLKLQICKFSFQRKTCNRENMSVEDRHQYGLILLRLYRTQLMLNSQPSLSQGAREVIEEAEGDQPVPNQSAALTLAGEKTFRAGTSTQLRPLAPRLRSPTRARDLPTDVVDKDSTFSSSLFNINIVPSAKRSLPGRRLTTNSSHEIMTRLHRARDENFVIDANTKDNDAFQRPLIHIRKINNNDHFGQVRVPHPKPRTIPPPVAVTSPISPSFIQEPIGAQQPFVPSHVPAVRVQPKQQFWQQPQPQPQQPLFRVTTPEGQRQVVVIPHPRTLPSPSEVAASGFRQTNAAAAANALAQQQNVILAQQQSLALAQQQSLALAASRQSALQGLLTCCQEQAPGCRQLCSKEISKDEIKRALVSQQCPPLSMTSVISCFPRYYNTAPVAHCCARSPNLPAQCQALCLPDFKPTFAHIACIDHINTIVDCYRDVLQ